MANGYVLEVIETSGEMSGKKIIYIPKSEKFGPVEIGMDVHLNPTFDFGLSLSRELAVRNGQHDIYLRKKQIEVPTQIVDMIKARKDYSHKEDLAFSILKGILSSDG